MNDLTFFWLMMGLVFVLTIVLLALFWKKTEFEIFNDLIVINDFVYPASIPNYAIKSISMVERLPRVMMRSNGYSGMRMWKGIFRVLGGKRALFYVEDHKRGPLVKIETVRESIYINFKDREQTHRLYEELTKTVKIMNESELADCHVITAKRSWVIVGIFIGLTAIISLLPTMI